MIEIISYQPKYAASFKELNEAWITQFFTMEDSDRKMLNDPEGYILNKGGEIIIALMNGNPVGTCALIPMKENVFELAKMAVSPEAQGKRIGWKIGLSTIEKAKELGAKRVYLETNSVLKPAIALYHKLGFKEVVGIDSPYNRCNVQMELKL